MSELEDVEVDESISNTVEVEEELSDEQEKRVQEIRDELNDMKTPVREGSIVKGSISELNSHRRTFEVVVDTGDGTVRESIDKPRKYGDGGIYDLLEYLDVEPDNASNAVGKSVYVDTDDEEILFYDGLDFLVDERVKMRRLGSLSFLRNWHIHCMQGFAIFGLSIATGIVVNLLSLLFDGGLARHTTQTALIAFVVLSFFFAILAEVQYKDGGVNRFFKEKYRKFKLKRELEQLEG